MLVLSFHWGKVTWLPTCDALSNSTCGCCDDGCVELTKLNWSSFPMTLAHRAHTITWRSITGSGRGNLGREEQKSNIINCIYAPGKILLVWDNLNTLWFVIMSQAALFWAGTCLPWSKVGIKYMSIHIMTHQTNTWVCKAYNLYIVYGRDN